MESLVILLFVLLHAGSIARFVRVYGSIGWALGTHYGARVLAVYLGSMVVLSVSAFVVIGSHQTRALAVICFLAGISLWILQSCLQGALRAAGAVSGLLGSDWRAKQPSLSSVLVIIPMYVGVTALAFPMFLYSVYAPFFLGLLMTGVTIVIAWPSDNVKSTKVLAGLTTATFAVWILCGLFPAHIRASVIARNNEQNAKGRENIINALKTQRDQHIKTENAIVWRVTNEEAAADEIGTVSGCPGIDKGGIKAVAKTTGNKDGAEVITSLPKDTVFRIADIEASTINCGEPLIRIYLPDGKSWVQPYGFGNMYVAISDTDLASGSAQSNDRRGGGDNNTTEAPFTVGQTYTVTVPANVKWFNTGLSFPGKRVRIHCGSDQWTNGGKNPIYAGCAGSGSWSGLLVPSAPFRALVAKTSEQPGFHVGNDWTGTINGGLELSINDTDSFSDNKGSQAVVVEVES